MRKIDRYYQPSGVVPLKGAAYMLLCGVLAATVLGGLYICVWHFNPIFYCRLFLPIAYGVGIALCLRWSAEDGKVRNSSFLAVVGLLLGAVAVYMSWVWWILLREHVFLMHPRSLWPIIQSINHTGSFTAKRLGFGTWAAPPTGAELYIYWGMEAATIIGISALGSLSTTMEPFCEHCNRWADRKKVLSPMEPISNPKHFKDCLERGDYAPLNALKKFPGKVDDFTHTQVSLMKCPACSLSNFLTVIIVTAKISARGKIRKYENRVVENLILDSNAYSAIAAVLHKDSLTEPKRSLGI